MVTIVVLIILATISINAVFGKNGIIKRAEDAKRLHEQSVTNEQEGLNEIDQYLENMINGITNENPEDTKRIIIYKNGKKVPESLITKHDNIIGEDKLGNKITLPGGFKTADDSGETVEDGIVIEDSAGNQFVWVPVSNIDGDGVIDNQSANGLIIRKDGSKVQITLGRYSFDRRWNKETSAAEGTGKSTLVQRGSEYNAITNESNLNETYKIQGFDDIRYHYEFAVTRESNYKEDLTGQNATAKNLQGFTKSVRDNHGYYIARYEASFGGGNQLDSSKVDTAEYVTNQKPLSKPSTNHTRASNIDTLTEGMLWNYVNQGDASKASRNMYAEHEYVESDLLNSYMWDTAIVYIQAMGYNNYATANCDTIGNTAMLDTGKTGDEKCHIFDMAGNLNEWTTEYCTIKAGSKAYPCTDRGGNFSAAKYCTSDRTLSDATTDSYSEGFGFRVGIYVK